MEAIEVRYQLRWWRRSVPGVRCSPWGRGARGSRWLVPTLRKKDQTAHATRAVARSTVLPPAALASPSALESMSRAEGDMLR